MLSQLQLLEQQKVIRPLDYQFARLIDSMHADPLLTLASAAVSYELGKGNVCLPLTTLSSQNFFDRPPAANQSLTGLIDIPARQWSEHLQKLPVISNGEKPAPIVYDRERLYLYRYWQYETNVADYLNRQSRLELDDGVISKAINQLFAEDKELNWQKVAAALAATRSFAVISGGPGTGKTTTVTKLLALLVEQGRANDKLPEIKLVAPTGKAAARLTESISGALGKLGCEQDIADAIPTQAGTIHRLLGVIPNSTHFRHNRENKLHLDILVVDEASMVDLPMMSRLLEAMPDKARLILLGDRDQLASVEAGSVLGDICLAADVGYSEDQTNMLEQLTGYTLKDYQSTQDTSAGDHLCMLRKSFRFDEHSGIGNLARAVNEENTQQLHQVLGAGYQDIAARSVDDDDYEQLIQQCVTGYSDYLNLIKEKAADQDIINAFNQFQLLCALRQGRFGVSGLNDTIENALRSAKLIPATTDSIWYEGRPVLITRNDHGLGLYNGDIGITVRDDSGQLRVMFELPGNIIKHLLPSRLPEHETVYAMTIHKSQGSEFAHTVMVLPDQINPVVTRELVYTGITRAKQKLDLYCDQSVLVRAINSPTTRASGLRSRLEKQ